MSLISWIEFKEISDSRGVLVSLEENKEVPFTIQRIYYLFGLNPDVSRGFHAHRDLKQVAICINGSCDILMDNGISQEVVTLNSPARGLSIDSMHWHEMHRFSDDCVLMVIASELYDEADYIRDYEVFLKRLIMQIHALSDVATTNIGEGTSIWQFSVVLAGAYIGRDCNICAHTFIENDEIIGDRVTVKCGVYLWDGIEVGDDVFIGPAVVFTNDKYPRFKHYAKEYPKTKIFNGASIGANATILPGVTIGEGALVGAGAVVTRNVPPRTLVIGNPAKIVENRLYS